MKITYLTHTTLNFLKGFNFRGDLHLDVSRC